VGLADTRQVPRIRVHPQDPNLAYVAAPGHTFGANHQRGVFRSKDGGATWQNVLFINDSTGVVDLCMDPGNPRVLYAASWQVQRTPWSLESGGPGSGLWKSVDSGDTWKRLDGEGLPKGVWGRVGVSVSGANSNRVWAVIEADAGGVFRSDNAGRTWIRTNDDRDLRQRAWYYTHVHADPQDADVVYVQNVRFHRSDDGGRTFKAIPTPHGDNHDLWIDPKDPQRMIEGSDGGAVVTYDGGTSWSTLGNQPTAQFYHVITKDVFPYRVYGAQQDNSTVGIASRTDGFGIDRTDWWEVGGGESGYIAPKPGEEEIVYAGSYGGYLTRYDKRTGEYRDVNPYPENPMGWGAEGAKYRFQWTFPIVISPHDPNTVYAGSNVLHRSTDEGQSWQVISPDLTRNDPSKLVSSGGPITQDNTSVEYYCTIFAMAESPVQKGLLWVGSDDGLVHVSRDAGRSWQNVTPPALPAWSTISQIDPVAATQGRAFWILDDVSPLRQATDADARAKSVLYEPAPAYLFGGPAVPRRDAGENPPPGALIYYRLAKAPARGDTVALEFLDMKGELIRRLTNQEEKSGEDEGGGGEGFGRGRAGTKIPARAGLNRFAWNLRGEDASRFKGLILWGGGLQGPQVVPGEYQVRLTAGGESHVQRFEVRGDPRLATTQADYQARHDLLARIRDKLTETHDAIKRIRDVRDQLDDVAARATETTKDSTIARAAKTLKKKLTAVEEALYQTKNRSRQDPLNYPIRLNNKLSALVDVVASAYERRRIKAWRCATT